MRLVKENEKELVLQFLKKDLANCLYIYMDILQYGVTGEVKVWRNIEEQLKTIVLSYHDGLQIYSTDIQAKIKEINEIVNQNRVSMIYGEKNAVEAVAQMGNRQYKLAEGLVYEITAIRDFGSPEGFEIGAEQDMAELAKLVCSDNSVGGCYSVNDLTEQYINRLKCGMGRNYFIRENGEIQAHIATYAENDTMAITSGLIARKNIGFMGYGVILECCLVNDLLKEGKRVFTFVNLPDRIRFLNIMGANKSGEYAKVIYLN